MVETLVVLSGRFREARFALAPAGTTTIGRDAACEVRLADSSVSHAHARLERRDGAIELIDLGSRNGTFVNGERVAADRPRAVNPGDEIKVGGVRLRLERGTAAASDLDLLAAQLAHVEDWQTVAALLTTTLARLLPAGTTVQCAIVARGGEYVPGDAGDRTTLPLPPRGRIDEALAAGVSLRLGKSEALVPLRARAGVPLRALHLAAERLSDADVAIAGAAAKVAARTPALRGGESGEDTAGDGGPTGAEVAAAAARAGIAGRSAALMSAVREVLQAAASTVPVLLLGESGTGKELLARALHAAGPRAAEPFVAVNCAALAPELVDSELFGHEKGSFTGAASRHRGLFEQAGAGTLFLDEVGDLSAAAQAKLLRTLDTGEIRRVGGTEVLSARARIACATNRDLARDAEAGRFRADLFFRIAGHVVRVPPLRERPEDVEPLLRHFLAVEAAESGTAAAEPSPDALDRLRADRWPGNVRELAMVARRLARGPSGRTIGAAEVDLQRGSPAVAAAGAPAGTPAGTPAQAIDAPGARGPVVSAAALVAALGLVPIRELERRHILAVLAACQGNKTKAAEVLGISRPTLYEKLKVYDREDPNV